MLVLDKFNVWIYLFMISETSGISYNQPILDSIASWNPNGTTIADNTLIGSYPYDIFINTNNTIYIPNQDNGQIIIWSEGNITSLTHISGSLLNSSSLFVTTTGDIYVDTFHPTGGVSKILLNSTIPISRMNLCQQCWDIFIDMNNTLYCSLSERHQIVATTLNNNVNQLSIVGGIGSAGSTSTMLRTPRGIFVDTTNDLYVADCENHRVQLFNSGKLTAITKAGSGSLNMTISLNCPTGIILDGANYLFIVDSNNHRIVSQGLNGFQCLVGCSNSSGVASNQLSSPWSLSFDSYGNIFVSDRGNSRVQKFNLISPPVPTTVVTYTPSTANCSNATTSCANTTSAVASCQSYEVSWNNHCYYLDGSGGNCAIGYSRATNAVLSCIANQFVGKTYRSTQSTNCCIWTADTYECFGFASQCNAAGTFTVAPTYNGAGCANYQHVESAQLTFCGSN